MHDVPLVRHLQGELGRQPHQLIHVCFGGSGGSCCCKLVALLGLLRCLRCRLVLSRLALAFSGGASSSGLRSGRTVAHRCASARLGKPLAKRSRSSLSAMGMSHLSKDRFRRRRWPQKQLQSTCLEGGCTMI